MARINRRDFLKFVGAGSVGVGAGFLYAESVKKPVELLIPQVVPPEEYSPGIARWYNTACRQCSAGCGISVRIREGRAKKIEGNAAHPVSRGRSCARGQAGLNVLYNPDRIRGPLRRTGERGRAEFAPIGWDEALTTVGTRLGNLKIRKEGERVRLLTGRTRGHLDELYAMFMEAMGSPHYRQFDDTWPAALVEAHRRVFDSDELPYFDIASSDLLVSFGADLAGTWLSPVHHAAAWGEFRQGQERSQGHRGRHVQIEPRMTLTGASADQWMPAAPGTENLLALAMARHLVTEGSYRGADRGEWQSALSTWTPERVAGPTGLSPHRIAGLGRAFDAAERPLAICGGPATGGTNGVATATAVTALNYLAGSVGRPGGVLLNAAPLVGGGRASRHATFRDLDALAQAIEDDAVDTLIVIETDPLHAMPANSRFSTSLVNVPYIVSVSSFMDATAATADVILPADTFLESWGDDTPEPGVGFPVVTLSQPVVSRIFDTRSPADIVVSLAHQVGSELPAVMPWTSGEEYLRDRWQRIYEAAGPASGHPTFEAFWTDALAAGVWGRESRGTVPMPADAGRRLRDELSGDVGAAEGDEADYPFRFLPYLSPAFLDGRGANQPWLQELPDPTTSVVYTTWIEMHPETAAQRGMREGDVVEVRSPSGTLRGPLLLYAGIRKDTVAVPVGQGHEHFGRYAAGRGANPLAILAQRTDDNSGALAWTGTRVAVVKTGQRVTIIKTAGESRTLGRQILGPHAGAGQAHGPGHS